MEILETIKEIFGRYFATQKAGDIKNLPDIYKELIVSWNSLAVSKGSSNYFDLQKNFFHIPETHYQKYLSNRDAFASKYSPQLDSATNSPHFLSKLPTVDLEYPDSVFNFVAQKYPELNAINDKISIADSDKEAYYRYSKEEDHYYIFVPQTNSNQKISMLIHELSHVINQEKYHHQTPDSYTDELEAHQIEMDLAKDISEDFFKAIVGEYLMCLVRAEFQISKFENPELDPTPLYKSCFEKYVGKQNPENIFDFLSDKKITHLPLTDLPVAVALVNLLT